MNNIGEVYELDKGYDMASQVVTRKNYDDVRDHKGGYDELKFDYRLKLSNTVSMYKPE